MNVKKSLSLILSAILVVSLISGCVNKPSSDTEGTNAVSASPSTDDREMSGNMYLEGLPIIKDKKTYKIAVSGHAMDQKPFDQKECVVEAEKATNIAIEWIQIPASGGGEKINIMLSGGDLPDAFMNAGINDSLLVQNLPQFHVLDEYIDKYAPNIKAIYNQYPESRKIMKQNDGKMYSIMTGQMTNNDTTSGLTYINKKWLDKLNLQMPTTMDEFYDVLKKFETEDPNGNGKDDEIPLAFCESVWATYFEKYLAPFGIYRAGIANNTVIRNGEVVFSKSLPEFREALEFYNKLAKEGLLDVEGFSQAEQQYAAKGTEGRYGVYLDYNPIYNAGKEYAEDYVVMTPLKGPQGYQVHDGNTMAIKGVKSGFTITKKCENTEVLVRWVDYLNSSFELKMNWEFGNKGVGWDGDASKWWVIDNGTYPGGTDYTTYKFTYAVAARTPNLLTQKEMQGMIYPDHNSVSAKRLGEVRSVEPYYPKENYQSIYEDSVTVSDRNKLSTELSTRVQSFTADSVVNGIDDAKWTQYLKDLEKLQVVKYTQMWKEYYDKTK